MRREALRRDCLLLAAVLAGAVAIIVAFVVVPPVRTDPLANAGSAVTAFWVNVAVHVVAIGGFLGAAFLGRSGGRTLLLVVAIGISLISGVVLLDAAAAFGEHGPTMHTATLALYVAAGADDMAALLAALAAVPRLWGRRERGTAAPAA